MANHIWTDAEIAGDIKYNDDAESIKEANAWHGLLTDTKWRLIAPANEFLSFYDRYIENPSRQIRSRRPFSIGNKVHDLGVGGGVHLFYLVAKGYDVTGSDLSGNAITATKTELERREREARLVECPMTALPFENDEFDVTISRATINHGTIQEMKKAVYEVARTTKPGGLFWVTVSSKRASDFNNGTEVVPGQSYAPQKGPEGGLTHTFMEAADVAAWLEPYFRVEEVTLSEQPPLVSAPNATDQNEYFGSEYVAVGVRRDDLDFR